MKGKRQPATADQVVERVDNDWLGWPWRGDLAGAAVRALTAAGLVRQSMPRSIRQLHFEFRYPLDGTSPALVASSLKEAAGS